MDRSHLLPARLAALEFLRPRHELVGAFVVVALENKLGDIGTFLANLTGIGWFNALGESVTTVTGVIFVICVLTFRRGIMGELIALTGRKSDKP